MKIYLILLSTLLTACASVFNPYDLDPATDDVVIINVVPTEIKGKNSYPYIYAIRDEAGERLTPAEILLIEYKKAILPPGIYSIKTRCAYLKWEARPEFRKNFAEPGQFNVRCINQFGKNIFGWDVVSSMGILLEQKESNDLQEHNTSKQKDAQLK